MSKDMGSGGLQIGDRIRVKGPEMGQSVQKDLGCHADMSA